MEKITLEQIINLLSSKAVCAALRYGYKNGLVEDGALELAELYRISVALTYEAEDGGN